MCYRRRQLTTGNIQEPIHPRYNPDLPSRRQRSSVLYGESSKRLAPPRNTKDQNTYNPHKRWPTHRPSTWHNLKGSPGVKTHNTNQHSSRARLQHSNHPPSVPSTNRVNTRSSQPTQPAVKRRRAQLRYTPDTTRPSGDTLLPPAWGAHDQEWPMDSPGHTAYF